MQRHRRFIEAAADGAIGLGVILSLELRFRSLPQRAGRIDLLRLPLLGHQLDRKLDVVGIGSNDAFDLVGFKILLCVLLQMQHDLGAARHAFRRLRIRRRDLEAGAAFRCPDPRLGLAGAAAGDHDAIRHHEGRVEADAELADQAGAFPGFVLAFVETGQEGLGAGPGDGAEIVDQLLPLHADAGVAHGECRGCLVRRDPDRGRVALGQQVRPRDRLVAQLVAGVRCVGNQFPQENVGLGIDRVHHQVQELGNFGLKGLGLRRSRRHVSHFPLLGVVPWGRRREGGPAALV